MRLLFPILFLLFIFSCEEEEELLNCEITNMSIDVGECINDSTYSLTLDFDYKNPGNEYFDLFARDSAFLGYYKLSDLPLNLDLMMSGLEYDYLLVSINDNSSCFSAIEWLPPECKDEELLNCEITNMSIDVGDCISDSTYSLTLDFDYENPGNEYFDLFVRDSAFLGYYKLSDLPLNLDTFMMSGLEYDYFLVSINDNSSCSAVIEWLPPDCDGGACEITNMSIDVGDCISDSTYSLTLDFDYENPGNEYFDLFVRDSIYLGYYELSDLPLNLDTFMMSGLEYDYLLVSINDNSSCFAAIEWLPPDCGG
jgi:hypothetical protein